MKSKDSAGSHTALGGSTTFFFGSQTVLQVVSEDIDRVSLRIASIYKNKGRFYSTDTVKQAISIWLEQKINSVWDNLEQYDAAAGDQEMHDFNQILDRLTAENELVFITAKTETSAGADEIRQPIGEALHR